MADGSPWTRHQWLADLPGPAINGCDACVQPKGRRHTRRVWQGRLHTCSLEETQASIFTESGLQQEPGSDSPTFERVRPVQRLLPACGPVLQESRQEARAWAAGACLGTGLCQRDRLVTESSIARCTAHRCRTNPSHVCRRSATRQRARVGACGDGDASTRIATSRLGSEKEVPVCRTAACMGGTETGQYDHEAGTLLGWEQHAWKHSCEGATQGPPTCSPQPGQALDQGAQAILK